MNFTFIFFYISHSNTNEIMVLATKLRKLRDERKWSQLDIANEMDISQSAYNKWETGQSKPTLKNLKKLADIFKIDFIDLVLARISNADILNMNLEKSMINKFNKKQNLESELQKISENQKQITTLLEEQKKLIFEILKKNI